MNHQAIKQLLDEKYLQFNRKEFIEHDPISIPHLFTQKQDIEIMGFWASILAWGQRATIIKKCHQLIEFMDSSPYDFIKHHQDADLKPFLSFKHRTFNATDALYFIEFFKHYYQQHNSLEEAFLLRISMKETLIDFNKQFFCLEYAPQRTQKHIATPARNSACKRLNMFLRWMVRQDDKGVDFGIWNKISPKDLICPCDVHVERTARKLGLISRPQTDWLMAEELTNNLRKFDSNDPVKYDFALFGMGIAP